jgi:hypothetical protein
MTESEQTEQKEKQQNGHDGRRTVVRAAALAAASGATALAAKKALSHDSSTEQEESRKHRDSGGDGTVMSSMATSAWSSARESLVPMIEDAASQAGEYLAKNGPELVRETIVPRFIRGFERGRESADND